MLKYIIDLKRTSKYKAADFLWLKSSKYLQIVIANTQYSNIKDTFEK